MNADPGDTQPDVIIVERGSLRSTIYLWIGTTVVWLALTLDNPEFATLFGSNWPLACVIYVGFFAIASFIGYSSRPRLFIMPRGFAVDYLPVGKKRRRQACSRKWEEIDGDFNVSSIIFFTFVCYKLKPEFKPRFIKNTKNSHGFDEMIPRGLALPPEKVAELLNFNMQRYRRLVG